MIDFTGVEPEFRRRVFMRADHILDSVVIDRLQKGGRFDAVEVGTLFKSVVEHARLIEDFLITTGLDPLKEEKNEECNLGQGNPQGPTGDNWDEGRVRNPGRSGDEDRGDGAAWVGEIDPSE